MTARYITLVSVELLDSRPWAEVPGLTLVREMHLDPAHPYSRWCEFEDADAPAELNGAVVTPIIGTRDNGDNFIAGRSVESVRPKPTGVAVATCPDHDLLMPHDVRFGGWRSCPPNCPYLRFHVEHGLTGGDSQPGGMLLSVDEKGGFAVPRQLE